MIYFINPPPSTLAVVIGNTIQLTVQANDTSGFTITYKWYRGSPTTTPTTKAIATTATLTITNATSSDTGNYYAVATNAIGGTAASTPIDVIVTTADGTPITPGTPGNPGTLAFTQPPPTTLAVVTGGTIQETVQATGGTGTISYAWYIGSPTTKPTTKAISKTSTLTITGITNSNAGTYYAIATDSTTTAVSTAMVVTIETVLAITTQPVSVSVKAGKVATFTVAASGGLTPYTYEWYQNGKVVSDATTATYTITSPTKAMNAAQIYVKISDSCTTPQIVTSNTATLTVKSSSTWWLWALIAAIVVVVVIIIIVVIIIVIHHKKSTNAANATDIPNAANATDTGVGQPNYGFASTGFNSTSSTGFNPTLY